MRLSVVATVLVFLAIPALASAHAGNNDPNVVHACIGNLSKIVRIVGVSGSCIPAPPFVAETPAHWAIQGPQGAADTNGTNGHDGTNGKDGTNGTRADGPCFDNANRYVDCGNGTVTDTVTGLIWLKQAGCLGVLDWAVANRAAAGLKDGDCDGNLVDRSSPGDWRLPTKDEWSATLSPAIALGCFSPSLTNDAGTACLSVGSTSFVGVALDFYWPSSTSEGDGGNAWYAYLGDGSLVTNFKGNSGGAGLTWRVWPVRGGPR